MPRPKISYAQEAEAVGEEEIATSSEDEQPAFVIACGGFTEAVYFQRLAQGCEGVRVQLLTPLKQQQGAEKPHLSSPL